jgi:hypothetical protein
MNSELRIFKLFLLLLALPLGLAIFKDDSFRYPCQDPTNWEKDICKKPLCDVTRTCPEHVFKGQRDPRLGPPKDNISEGTLISKETMQGACK